MKVQETCTVISQECIATGHLQSVAADQRDRRTGEAGTVCLCILQRRSTYSAETDQPLRDRC